MIRGAPATYRSTITAFSSGWCAWANKASYASEASAGRCAQELVNRFGSQTQYVYRCLNDRAHFHLTRDEQR